MAKDELLKLMAKDNLSMEELKQIRTYHISEAKYINNWFGITGADINGFIYKYIFNYKKDTKEVNEFRSDCMLSY